MVAAASMKREPSLPGPTVVSEKAYRFVPPRDSRFWPWFGSLILPPFLRKVHGIDSWELHGREKMQRSLDAGHGILVVPNHCNPADPVVLGLLVKAFGRNI